MALRTAIGNALISFGRRLARADGSEVAVDLSSHSISIKMMRPDKEQRAWDPDLYHSGNVFLNEYANPIKPISRPNKELEEPDTVDCVVPDGGEERHVEMISSERYGAYMKQDLISQLLNPQEKWRLLAYAILGVGFLTVCTLMASLSAAGAF